MATRKKSEIFAPGRNSFRSFDLAKTAIHCSKIERLAARGMGLTPHVINPSIRGPKTAPSKSRRAARRSAKPMIKEQK